MTELERIEGQTDKFRFRKAAIGKEITVKLDILKLALDSSKAFVVLLLKQSYQKPLSPSIIPLLPSIHANLRL